MATKTKDWWVDFFPEFRPLFGIVPGKVTNREVAYIIRKLGLKAGMSFLDCPCGIGRISIPLARKGIKVTGVDITGSYLAELSQKSKKLGLPISTVHADMRKISFDSKFDAAGNVWTSFGYFEKESDNLMVLKKLYTALKPGGKLLLHLMNRDWVVKNFTPCDMVELKGMKIIDNRHFDFKTSISISQWHFIKDGNERVFESRIRMYAWHELHDMMPRAGFSDVQGFGSMDNAPIDSNSRMLYIMATK
jgi:cyclopropane fatty-acyl-phospholipid synthase-like methyltransferase